MPSPVSEAHVRFVVSPEPFAHMKVGDRDSSPGVAGRFRQATIAALECRARFPLLTPAARRQSAVLRVVDATLRVPVDPARAEDR